MRRQNCDAELLHSKLATRLPCDQVKREIVMMLETGS